jgi:hypothetical protein
MRVRRRAPKVQFALVQAVAFSSPKLQFLRLYHSTILFSMTLCASTADIHIPILPYDPLESVEQAWKFLV